MQIPPISVSRMGRGVQGAQFRCGIITPKLDLHEASFVTPQYAVVYVLKGQGQFTDSRGRKYRLEPGHLFQRFPSRPHEILWKTQHTIAYLAVPCQVYELLELTGCASLSRPILDLGLDISIAREFAALAAEVRDCPDANLMDLLVRMAAFIVSLHRRDRAGAGEKPAQLPLARAAQLLSENLSGTQSLPEIARKSNLSYSAFRKQFVKRFGMSARDYRIRRRTERAMALLAQGNLKMKEISSQLGYHDEYAFSAQFKKQTGLAPTAFRKQHG
jgi:AraC-like DNA-binding protein